MPAKTSKKKRQARSQKAPSKKRASKKKVVKKSVAKKAAPAKKGAPRRSKAVKKNQVRENRVRGKRQNVDAVVFEPKGLGSRSGGQSGDLQGLSNRESADSESVDELLEEGNSFEAEVVKGIEDVPDADEGEVRTHEVPEDDVPGEYLEKEE